MWVAKLSPLNAPRNYNYFHDVMGFIGFQDTLQELLDYIRNPEDGYEELHLENTTGKDNEANSDGIKYYLTINSLYMGFPIEFEIYDLDDIDGCNELAKDDLLEVRKHINKKTEFYNKLIDVITEFYRFKGAITRELIYGAECDEPYDTFLDEDDHADFQAELSEVIEGQFGIKF